MEISRDPINSPLFDGSDSSLGGNGASCDYEGTPVGGAPPGLNDMIPSAGGGGCVTTGPFKKQVLSHNEVIMTGNFLTAVSA